MTQISGILNAEDKAAVIRSLMDEATPQPIPALLLLLMVPKGVDDDTRSAAAELLFKIVRNTTFTSSATVMYPPTPNPASRPIASPPKKDDVSVKMLIYALHMFVNVSTSYDQSILSDALKVFIKFTKIQMFCLSTRMLIDTATFAMTFAGKPDNRYKEKAVSLIHKIHGIAESNNDVDAMLALQSIFAIFPEIAPKK